MRSAETRFYADLADMHYLLDAFDKIGPLTFTRTLGDLNADLVQLTDPRDLSHYLRTEPLPPSNAFLITRDCDPVIQRRIEMEDGSGVRMAAADLHVNRHSILITLGGQLDGDNTLIATKVNSTSEAPKGRQLYRAFKRVIVRKARHSDGFYLQPGAMEKWRMGWRLTPGVQHPRSLDLPRPRAFAVADVSVALPTIYRQDLEDESYVYDSPRDRPNQT
jgi:hypothetical protein